MSNLNDKADDVVATLRIHLKRHHVASSIHVALVAAIDLIEQQKEALTRVGQIREWLGGEPSSVDEVVAYVTGVAAS